MNGEPLTPPPRRTVGCVRYLNARPLTAGLEDEPSIRLVPDVPSALLDRLVSGDFELALCPVIDYQTSPTPLRIVPAGAIGCDGATMTVRLFSRVPFAQLTAVRADPDSHSSVALMQIILHDVYGVRPSVQPAVGPAGTGDTAPDAMLLIGDKVVTHAPSDQRYPHQVDLGQAWRELTGLPFVFAVWMARPETDLGALPEKLNRCRLANERRLDAIAAEHGPPLGWPIEPARRYLGRLLRYGIGPRQLDAMERFWRRAYELGLTERRRPLQLHRSASRAAQYCQS